MNEGDWASYPLRSLIGKKELIGYVGKGVKRSLNKHYNGSGDMVEFHSLEREKMNMPPFSVRVEELTPINFSLLVSDIHDLQLLALELNDRFWFEELGTLRKGFSMPL